MCLDRIDEIRILAEDQKVYKVVSVSSENGAEKSSCYEYRFNKHLNLASTGTVAVPYGSDYKTGFHCFVDEKSCRIWDFVGVCKIRSYIIPKNTRVIIGEESLCDGADVKVIVNPVLVNPRIPI